MSVPDAIGWTATGLFASSYFVSDPRRLRLVQAGAALLWIAYGVLLGAAPVIGANAAVAAIALLSLRRAGGQSGTN